MYLRVKVNFIIISTVRVCDFFMNIYRGPLEILSPGLPQIASPTLDSERYCRLCLPGADL